jgi:hypothetical protein
MYCIEDEESTIENYYTNNQAIRKDKEYLIDLLKIIRDDNIKMKKVLELKYYYLSRKYSIIQCSVIILSTFSAFIQGIEQLTEIVKLKPGTVSIITLIISTLISLLLSIAKFFKISERKESISNLLENISHFNNKVIANIKKIKYWKVNIEVNNNENKEENNNKEINDWNTFSSKIKDDINGFFEEKLEIMNGYESLIDTYERTKFDIQSLEIKNKFTIKEEKINKRFKKDYYNIKTNNYYYKRLLKKICLCCIHTYNCICCIYCKDIDVEDEDFEISEKINENFRIEKEKIKQKRIFREEPMSKNDIIKTNKYNIDSEEEITGPEEV